TSWPGYPHHGITWAQTSPSATVTLNTQSRKCGSKKRREPASAGITTTTHTRRPGAITHEAVLGWQVTSGLRADDDRAQCGDPRRVIVEISHPDTDRARRF